MATDLASIPGSQKSDLSPLAWVLEELQRSLDQSNKALRRFLRERDESASSGELAREPVGLRAARTQVHQGVGALEMVGEDIAALYLRTIEAGLGVLAAKPSRLSESSVSEIERACFALVDYLGAKLAGRAVSSVGLFPQYEAVAALAGAERIHPADLWPHRLRWAQVQAAVARSQADPTQLRQGFERGLLDLMRGNAPAGAAAMLATSCQIASRSTSREAMSFWAIASAWAEALGKGLLAADLHVKRTGSRLSMQVGAWSRGDVSVSERLATDMLFFCAVAGSGDAANTPWLTAVRRAHGFEAGTTLQYETPVFGLVDPAVVQQARKRLALAKDSWTAVTGGDMGRARLVVDQFAALADAIERLHLDGKGLGVTLNRVAAMTAQSSEPPRAELGLEVATALLFIEASLDDLDPANPQAALRASKLAQRVEEVRSGGPSAPLEAWMEDLYRRVSERQTMGTVMAESRSLLGEVEKNLDVFFRDPTDNSALREVPSRLLQLRGVLSLLGLDAAAQAATRMRDAIDEILVTQVDPDLAKGAGTFDKLADNLGALGLLIDMLSYQPGLAKQLFVFDAATGVLQPVMGRTAPDALSDAEAESTAAPVPVLVDAGAELGALVDLVQHDSLAPAELAASLGQLSERAAISDDLATAAIARELAQTAAGGADSKTLVAHATEKVAERVAAVAPPEPPTQSPEPEFGEDDLLDIFLEEAGEVLASGREALATLHSQPGDAEALTVVRRAFHTIKGSSRMVGLNELGEAAWAMEQVFNVWLADAHPAASADLIGLAEEAFDVIEPWLAAIRQGDSPDAEAARFHEASLAFRQTGTRLGLRGGAGMAQVPAVQASDSATEAPPEATDAAPDFVFDLSDLTPVTEVVATAAVEPLSLDDGFLAEAVDTVADAASVVELGEVSWPTAEPQTETAPEAVAQASLEAEVTPPPVPEPTLETATEPVPEDVRVVGHLRIGIALHNVYLNEADEKSRRLGSELAEWAVAGGAPVSETAVMDAHSLAGSSATVGFEALAELAHKLELGLLRNRKRGRTELAEIPAFTAAADEIRRLLHQFAAGFLRPASESVWVRLNALEEAAEPGVPNGEVVLELAAGPSVPDQEIQAPFETRPAAEPPEPAVAAPSDDRPDVPVQPVSLLSGEEEDDEVDTVDAPDADLFPIFDEEARELMPALSAQLRALQAKPGDAAALAEVLRGLHTLKGSARLAGAMRFGELAHRMESAIEAATPAGATLAAAQLAALQARFDRMEAVLDGLRTRDAADYAQALKAAEAVAAAPVVAAPANASAADAAVRTPLDDVPPGMALPPTGATGVLAAAGGRQVPVVQTRGSLTGQLVRVRAQLLDRMVNQAGEVSIARSRLETQLSQLKASLADLTDNLERMRQHLRDIELQGETQMQSRIAAAKEAEAVFDPLEMDRFTRFQELTRMMAESVNDVATVQRNLQRTLDTTEDDLATQARLTRELQRDLLRTRMVEFDSISERLYRLVRLASKETGKQVRLDVQGGNIDMDRGVLERMAAAFEHLLRNCVVHGIERPEVRQALGKDPVGTITVTLQQAGNDVSVSFADDGGGIDTDKVFARAVRHGLVSEAQRPGESELMQMIFLPGFSTATEVSELAGRGIGMDVVRSEINALGGRIETHSERGLGTRFELVLPLTTAVTQVVMLRVGELTVGVPANLVEIVRRASPEEVRGGYASGRMRFAGEDVPFHWLGALLQGTSRGGDLSQRTLPVVVLRSAAQRVATHVDEVLGNQEVVVKNLGPQLSRLPGLAGMSVLASGAIVLIYNPVALATVYGEQARALLQTSEVAEARAADLAGRAGGGEETGAPTAATTQAPLVLVVDDSITVRRVTQRLLQREGYRVELAKDGLDALEKLQGERPCVVLSDIEMPRMDGFDLARTIRGDKGLRTLPIVMITSRLADKHREYAREIGTDHYLGKPYSEEELLALVKRYAAVPYSAITAPELAAAS
jgi:chemosensory pili system protein ChpA (sensor histidine kinase/response regulator)